jgi:TolB protein
MLQEDPHNDLLLALRAECRFKAHFDQTTGPIKPKRSAVNWRRLAARGVVAFAVIVIVLLGVTVTRSQLLPLMAESQSIQDRKALLQSAENALAMQQWAVAERQYKELLALDPESVAAKQGLAAVARERDFAEQYQDASQRLAQGDTAGALAGFTKLQLAAPNYRDVNSRILEVRKLRQMELLYEQAQTQIQLGYNALALATFNEIQSTSTDFRRQEVQDALYVLNVNEGRTLLSQSPDQVAAALDYFDAALRQRPSAMDVIIDQRLAAGFLAGRDAYNAADWIAAITHLRGVFSEQPDYLGNAVPPLLYQAYINYGDRLRSEGDLYKAYDHYRLASELPLVDTVVALGRMAEIEPSLTPTPTPAPTATVGPTAPPATATPTPTPQPLLTFQGRIIFKSDNEAAPGYYVMDSNGGNRQYLGPFELYDEAVATYRETERLSPDGQFRVHVGSVDARAQVLLSKTYDPTFAPKPLTRMSKIAYDPVWAPDGSVIAFVTQENESDDIWVISPDGSYAESLVRNEWEWEKHPSWSRDSSRIAFMSNREGTLAIWVMERNGRNPRNISNVPWPEYDPVWIK